MSQQSLDLKSSVHAVRRHRKLFVAVVIVGLLIGAAFAVLNPPKLSSTALVVLPQAASDVNQSDPTALNTEMQTQTVIASSDPVLAAALPHVSPAVSLQQLEHQVKVTNVAGSILSITVTAKTASEAETTANAVAESYKAYVGSSQSPVGFTSAKILESATTANGSSLAEEVVIYAVLGLVGGALVGLIVATALSRNERRLRERDAIANSIGAPVLASLPVGHPADAGSWVTLLTEYQPDVVHGLGLSRMLQQVAAGSAGGDASITVVSLSSDRGALALGPQLAAFAAAQGIPTALVLGPQQDPNATATLRTACSVPLQPSAGRRPLRLVTADDAQLGQLEQLSAQLVVVVATVDPKEPRLPRTTPTTATVLGVSAGAATAEELARAATAAVSAGRDIAGILVADPDPDDQSTGRIPRLVSSLQRRLPTRENDVPTEINR
jgi:capsular polysaccharide biosynthesis protein